MAERKLALLPFSNRDGSDDHEYLGVGIIDEMLHALSWVDGLYCAPLTSSFRFPSGDADVPAVAKRLAVDHLLLGDFQRVDDSLLLSARIVTSGGKEEWTGEYSGSLADLQQHIDGILEALVETLALDIRDTNELSVRKASTENPAAYDHYLHGLNYFRRYDVRNVESALKEFTAALREDRQFARAWARLAECYAKYYMNYDSSRTEYAEKALDAARNAVKLAPDFARAHAALGTALMVNKDLIAAEDAFDQAIEINPSLFDAWFQHARTCFQMGNLKKAAEKFERASLVQPDDYQTPLLLRQVYLSLGRFDEAQAVARRGVQLAQRHLELNRKDARAIYLAAGSLIQLGQYRDAIEWSERALAVAPDDPMINYNVACCYAQAGEPEKALNCLEKAKSSGLVSAAWLKNDSDLISLHDEERFKSLLQELA